MKQYRISVELLRTVIYSFGSKGKTITDILRDCKDYERKLGYKFIDIPSSYIISNVINDPYVMTDKHKNVKFEHIIEGKELDEETIKKIAKMWQDTGDTHYSIKIVDVDTDERILFKSNIEFKYTIDIDVNADFLIDFTQRDFIHNHFKPEYIWREVLEKSLTNTEFKAYNIYLDSSLFRMKMSNKRTDKETGKKYKRHQAEFVVKSNRKMTDNEAENIRQYWNDISISSNINIIFDGREPFLMKKQERWKR